MSIDPIYRGLTTQFIHDGCHNRAEEICRRLFKLGEKEVGKLWILPSNLQFGRIRVPNPLFIDWLTETTFRMPNVCYSDTVTLHGKSVLWKYHVVAAQKRGNAITVYDSTYGTLSDSAYLKLLSTETLERNVELETGLLARYVRYGEALTEADFSDVEFAELLSTLR